MYFIIVRIVLLKTLGQYKVLSILTISPRDPVGPLCPGAPAGPYW